MNRGPAEPVAAHKTCLLDGISHRLERSTGYELIRRLYRYDAEISKMESAKRSSRQLCEETEAFARQSPIELYAEYRQRRKTLRGAALFRWFAQRVQDYHRPQIEAAIRLVTKRAALSAV